MNSADSGRSAAATGQQHGSDASGALLSGLCLGLILTVVPMALIDQFGPGIFVLGERIDLILGGMFTGAGGAALRHRSRVTRRLNRREHP